MIGERARRVRVHVFSFLFDFHRQTYSYSSTCFEDACCGVLLSAQARCGGVLPDRRDVTFLARVLIVAASARARALEGAADVGVLSQALDASAGLPGGRTRNCGCMCVMGQTR